MRQINAFLGFIKAAETITTTNSAAYSQLLAYPTMQSAGVAAGLSGLVLQLASVVDNVTATFIGLSPGLPPLSPAGHMLMPPRDATAPVGYGADATGLVVRQDTLRWALSQTITPLLDAAEGYNGYQDTQLNGAVYYLSLLFLPRSKLVRAMDQGARYLFVDRKGLPYSNGRMCLTSLCLGNTVTALNTMPIASLPTTVFGMAAWPSSLGALSAVFSFLVASRETLFLALWVPYIIFIVMGVWVLTANVCCAPSRWQKAPASCLAGMLCCWTPCAFLLAGALVPIMLVLSDFCGSGANLGQNLILAMGDSLCPTLGGVGGAKACAYTVPMVPGQFSLNFTLDLPTLYRGVIGGGDGGLSGASCSSDVQVMVTSLVSAVGEQFMTGIPYVVTNGLGDPGMCLRTTPAGVALLAARAAAAAAAAAAANATYLPPPPSPVGPTLSASLCTGLAAFAAGVPPLLKDLGNTTTSCDAMGGAITELRSAMCCNVVTPLWWFVGAWCAACWASVVLGIPAAIAARKRFPSKPWGQQVLDAAEQAEELKQLAFLKSLGVSFGGEGEGGAFPPGSPSSPTPGSPANGAASPSGASTPGAKGAPTPSGAPAESPKDSPPNTGTQDGRSASRTADGKLDIRTVTPKGGSARGGAGLSPGALSLSIPVGNK